MNQEVIRHLNQLLKEENEINIEYFLGFDEDQNLETFENQINKEFESLSTQLEELEIEENAFSEDSYYDIDSLDISGIEELFEDSYEERLKRLLQENFEHLENIVNEDYEESIPNYIEKEYKRILEELNQNEKLDKMSDSHFNIVKKIQDIQKIVSDSSSTKDSLAQILEDLEEEEKTLQSYKEELENLEEESEINYCEENIEYHKKQAENLEEDKNNLIENLKDNFRDIDWIRGDINDIIEKNNYIEEIEKYIEDYRDSVLEELLYLLEQTKNKNAKKNKAQILIESNESIESFLENKEQEEEDLKEHVVLSKNEKVHEFKIFNDNSVAIKNNEGWDTPKISTYAYYNATREISAAFIDYKLRKKQKYKDTFRKAFFKENNLDMTLDTIDFLLRLEPVLNNKGITLDDIKGKKVETIYDNLIKIEKNHKIEKYAKCLLSNKYKHFITEKSLKIFEAILDANITKSHVQNNIGIKLASFKSNEEFEEALQGYLNLINKFSKESIIEKTKDNNCDILIEEENLLVLKIHDYQASNILGEEIGRAHV